MAEQELFDGEVKTTIEDDENLSFRRASPATPGSRVISWADLKALLRTLFVWLGDVAQEIDGVKTFLKSPIVPDPTTNLQAVNLRTLNAKTSDPNSIKFNPEYVPVSTQEGEIYWNGKWHTIEYDTGLGATIRVGQIVYDVFYNDTGETIEPLRALHLRSAVSYNSELYPVFELADASDYEKIQGTIALSACSVEDGELGICTDRATKIKGDTSAWPAGSQLWVTDDGSGELTNVKPVFPSVGISVGGNYSQDVNGYVFVNVTTDFGDIFHEAWDGSVIESFNFRTSSDGAIVTGTLENVNPLLDLTLNFSSGTFRLDTTTSPKTIVLTPGTDGNEQTNYVYIPKSTKILTVSTSGWPTTEHCRVAELEIQSASTTLTDGGTLGNQNVNDHVKKEDNNGHILHITEWIREQFATMRKKYGSESTFDNTGGNGYIEITGGHMLQAHKQTLEAFSMAGGDEIRVWNDESGLRPRISNLTSISTYSDASTWNNQWSKVVVWRVGNEDGEYSPVMLNKPKDGYNSEANAIDDLGNYADYTIPDNFKTKAVLIGAFVYRVSGGVITYNGGYEDLRGQIPIVVAGGGGGGGGVVTTFLALTDTFSSYAGRNGHTLIVDEGGNAVDSELKGWLWNAARTFYSNIVSLATQNWDVFMPDKGGTIAFLDDIGLTIPTQTPVAIADAATTNIPLDNTQLNYSFADGNTTWVITVNGGSDTEVKKAVRILDNSANNDAVIITLSNANMTIKDDDGNNLTLAANSVYELEVKGRSTTVCLLSIIPDKA